MELASTLWNKLDMNVFGGIKDVKFLDTPILSGELNLNDYVAFVIYDDKCNWNIIAYASVDSIEGSYTMNRLYWRYQAEMSNLLGFEVRLALNGYLMI